MAGNSTKLLKMMGDFETTVYEGQDHTEVWASALVPIKPYVKGNDNYSDKDVTVLNSIEATFEYLTNLKRNVRLYYHNLKFDGEFWLSWLRSDKRFIQEYDDVHKMFKSRKETRKLGYTYSISDMGQWYEITIKTKYGKVIQIWDSLKLLPFSVKKLGADFETKHRKLSMEYVGERHAGGTITPEEKKYISNDVLVVAEALSFMFSQGHDKITIGACCMHEFKLTVGDRKDYEALYPNLSAINLKEDEYGSINADAYCRRAYRGGWCYVRKDKAGKIYTNGCVADVNSLYPSVMHSISGCEYPYGSPHFWKGEIPGDAKKKHRLYFVRFRCRFKIKEGFLPFVQIKGTWKYKGNEMLETSDLYLDGKYYNKYRDTDGKIKSAEVELTMTSTDFELFNKHYDIYDLKILDGCWFYSMAGMFDDYIDTYRELKMRSKGAMRQLAKLFLNNLYGKLATSMNDSFKLAYIGEDGALHYKIVDSRDKTPGYIAAGAFITSNARAFTITAAQKNYEHFIYADTDSIHCDCEAGNLVGVPIDDVKFCHWKIENTWDKAIFARQKTYIECEGDDYLIKCAGMPANCKAKIKEKLKNGTMTLDDFRSGLTVDGKLMPKHIKGGIVLMPTTFAIK